ncbi:MAG: CDP-alcohol phosphatidyltransferase family protein [Deltaproteobacteria bacterium]|nr:CDP-alcohol phosphatidyltransferase family protein [Deltaproteobacteria bacterium]
MVNRAMKLRGVLTEDDLPVGRGTPGPYRLPPLSELTKSREVEDPVNVWVHRPLAYAFVWSVFKTPMTANMITFLSLVVGVMAGVMFIVGTPAAMVAGGLMLWSSAILDGADGILARAKHQQSQFGRALDGSADMIVAGVTVSAAVFHMWQRNHDLSQVLVAAAATGLTLVHLWLYDFYKEGYLRATRLDRGGEGEDSVQVARRIEEAHRQGPIIGFCVEKILVPYLQMQERIVDLTNPLARSHARDLPRGPVTAETYRRHNYGPMRVWTMVSLAPHCYLFSLFAVTDRIDLYLWLRLVVMNVLFLVALVWQKRATLRTLDELAPVDGRTEAATAAAA